MASDYYKTLGVEKDASAEDIKKAYRKLAKEFHPDRNKGNEEAAQKFKEINEAYQVLSDDQKRQQYDTFGNADFGAGGPGAGGFDFGGFDFGGFSGSGFSGFSGFSDIFDMFGNMGRNVRRRGPQRGADLRVNLRITFEEAAFGTKKTIHVTRTEKCEECGGTGEKRGTGRHTCHRCGGSGEVREPQQSFFGGQTSIVRECPECDGRGTVADEPCAACRGKGTVQKTRTITVTIPAGIDNGQGLNLPGEGQAGEQGGPPGDLLVYVTVKPDRLFMREGSDLLLVMEISMVQAALGDTIEVPTLDGHVRHKIPEGTQPGTVFRIRGKGIKNLNSSRVGDLLVRVEVTVPKRLTEKQKKLLKDFAAKARLPKVEFRKPREGF